MDLRDIGKVTVLGTGMMGPGIALLFARKGYDTVLWGRNPDKLDLARSHFDRNLLDLEKERLISTAEAEQAKNSIRVTGDLEQAVSQSQFICEAVIENLEVKQQLFSRIEACCARDTLLASNTSTLLPSAISARLKHRERLLVTHFWNPAHLVPLVEVCGAPQTSTANLSLTMELLERIGKAPVLMKKEILGFIGNRLMHALNREAISLVQDGVVEPEDVDRVVLASFGPRFANIGPLEYLDFVGLDLVHAIQGYLYGDLDRTAGPLPLLSDLVKGGRLGVKSGGGFFDWSGRDPQDVRARRDQEFLRRMKADDDE